MLRHSFATHVLEKGNDSRVISRVNGHYSINTTGIYTRLALNTFDKVKILLDL